MASKERVAELAKQVRDAARLHDPIARATIELVKLSSEDLKESLVDAVGDDMLRTQGAARTLQRLHRELTVLPPNIPKPQE